MSASSPSVPQDPSLSFAPSPSPSGLIPWRDERRRVAFDAWLQGLAAVQGLTPASLRIASADASFRRYFRLDSIHGTRIVMDAPPEQENCEAFVRIARLMADAGLNVPEVLAWDEAQGFMLLTDLGPVTMIEIVDRERPITNLPLYMRAVDALIAWQLASKPGVLPPYDQALLSRELALFPDWYLERHRGVTLEGEARRTLDEAFAKIVQRNLAQPQVYVHRDFMPRNLMVPAPRTEASSPVFQGTLSPESGPSARPDDAQGLRLGVLDFQDAVYGPITYDIASLMRDAFLSWEEDFVLEVTVRYWEKARKAGLPVGNDFGEFYRDVEWMGLQRHLKVAGIFARLTLRDGKPKYLADAPRFLHYIRHAADRYRELGPLLKLIDQIEGTEPVVGFAYGRM